MEHEHERLGKGARKLRNQKRNRDHLNYCIVEINQNTEESPGSSWWLTIIQNPVRNHQLTLVRKTYQKLKKRKEKVMINFKQT